MNTTTETFVYIFIFFNQLVFSNISHTQNTTTHPSKLTSWYYYYKKSHFNSPISLHFNPTKKYILNPTVSCNMMY